MSFRDLGLAVAILILAINPLVSLINVFRTPKRSVSFETEYATREEVEQVRSDVQVVDSKVEKLQAGIVANGETRRISIEGKVEAVRAEQQESAKELQKDIAAVANDLSELKGETKMIAQTLARLEMSGRVGI